MRKLALALASVAAIAVAMPAAAVTYAFNYTTTTATAPFTATGSFTVSGGFVSSISGNVDGDTITSLQSTSGLTPYSATQFLSPDNQFYFNNAYYAADPVFDVGGILFYSAGGAEYNLYGNGPGSYTIIKAIPFGSTVARSDGTLSVAAVPEASSWIMLVAGFGLVGVSTRRRKVTVAA